MPKGVFACFFQGKVRMLGGIYILGAVGVCRRESVSRQSCHLQPSQMHPPIYIVA